MPGMDGFINFNGTLEGSIAGGDSGAVKDVKTNASGSYQSVVDEVGNAMIDLSIYAKETDVSEDIQSLSGQLTNKQDILDYSTEEQNTGRKWTDGKSIYCRTLHINNFKIDIPYEALYYGSFNITDYISDTAVIFGVIDKSYLDIRGVQRGILSIQPEYPNVLILNNRRILDSDATLVVTLEYTKTV